MISNVQQNTTANETSNAATWGVNSLQGKEEARQYGTVLEGTYLGHQPCFFEKGKLNELCSDVVKSQVEKQKLAEKGPQKKRPSAVEVKVSTEGIDFLFGASAGAKFHVAIRDIASMSLCPKGKSGKLKIAAVLCRSTARRINNIQQPGNKGSELEMICHVWRPKDGPALWDFYASFESMLKDRGGVDPYLRYLQDSKHANAPKSEHSARDGEDSADLDDILGHFDKSNIDRLEDRIDNSVKQARASQISKKMIRPSQMSEDADSDIEIDFSDDDMSDDDEGSNDSNKKGARIITLGGCDEDLEAEANC